MSDTPKATVDEIPLTTAQTITPGGRARIISNITPLVLANLTGTIEDTANKPGRCTLYLDASSTEALRRDHRAGHRRPADNTRRARVTVPTACLIPADNDN
ncbi:hypothetical protein ACFWP3_18960 [Streptomyces sp. NPDC058525]|uniref:hypothetical protein n=1 Tax=Streptomyces sp. NPDC058525 TaxID=3346538 RepID=UPI003668028F